MLGERFEMSAVLLVGLYIVSSCSIQTIYATKCAIGAFAVWKKNSTYKWQTAVCAPANLGLICVDKDAGVSKGTAASVAGNNTVVCPAYGLLVNKLDSGIWAWLQ